MTDEEVQAVRLRYEDCLRPLFLPNDPISNDVVNYLASLLRIVGMEDGGWDPHLESRATLEDINSFLQIELPSDRFPDAHMTQWRMGLLMYSHMVEMDAPYEVLTNLLRFQLGKGYSPNPFYAFLDADQRKRFKRSGLYPKQKIDVIKFLAQQCGLEVGALFDEFYDARLRNAISHSDFILTDKEFRCRSGTGATRAFKIPLEKLNETITKAKAFFSTFFSLERAAREVWGAQKHRAIPYDPHYKGLMEILADDEGLLCGFKVHWPNNSESTYRRTKDGIDMTNCYLDLKNATISLFVNQYAVNPGSFSPLVEIGSLPKYTALEGTCESPMWPDS